MKVFFKMKQKYTKRKYLFVLGGTGRGAYGLLKFLQKKYSPDEYRVYFPWGDNVRSEFPDMYEFDGYICYRPKGNIFKRFHNLYSLYKSADHIVIYGLLFGLRPLLVLLTNKNFLKKLSWIEWGGDLYNWKRKVSSVKDLISNVVGKIIREAASPVGVNFPMDEEIFKQEFKSNAKCMFTPLMSHRNVLDVVEGQKIHQRENKNVVRIQVGHNALQFGNHISILHMLERFKNEEIQLVIPMAHGVGGINGGLYGGIHYKDAVYKMAGQIFQKKAIPYFKTIPLTNYYSYLWNVDIVVLNLYRQAGLGNILVMLYMKKKVFLPAGTQMYKFFQSMGVKVYDTNKIPEMSYEEFISPPEDSDISWIKEFYDPVFLEKHWDDFMEEVENQQGDRL